MDFSALVLLPIGLGLLGFIEPCTVGSSLLFVKVLEGKSARAKLLETAVFAGTRTLFIGALGALAALIGSSFLDLQRWFWIALGSGYVLLGSLYLAGAQWRIARALGPTLASATATRRAAALGLLFGLNVPACAAPLLAGVFAASLGAAGTLQGFWLMAVFGLALSLPLIAAVSWDRARATLDQLARLTGRTPLWTGVVLILLGVWSVYLGLIA